MTLSRPSPGHSPAPWYIHAPAHADRVFICTVGVDDNIAVVPASPHHDAAANARLIAAAPELLEHLQNVLDEYQEHAEDMYTQSKTVSSARAAIANAAGRDDSGLFLSAITPLFP